MQVTQLFIFCMVWPSHLRHDQSNRNTIIQEYDYEHKQNSDYNVNAVVQQ